MARSLLELCAEAIEGTGIPEPAAIVAGDELGKQLLRLAHTSGTSILKYNWQALTKEDSFTTLAAALQSSLEDIADDIHHIIPKTMWNRTAQQPIYGPLSPQAWQRIQATTMGPARTFFRIMGNNIYFSPTPTAGESVYFEYITKNWVSNAAGDTFSNVFEDDTDLVRIDEESFLLELRWRFREAKGMEYAEAMRDAELQIQRALGVDTPKQTLNLSPGYSSDGADSINWQVPEGNWYQ